jgi:hypothetical protein
MPVGYQGYCNIVDAAILVFDVTMKETFAMVSYSVSPNF